MKKILYLTIVLVIAICFSSCNISIVGEGKISNKDSVFAKPFQNVVVRGNFQAVFVKGDKAAVRMESHENILQNIEIKIVGDDLLISEKNNVERTEIYKITITSAVFNEISIHGNVQAESSGLLNQEKMKIVLEDNSKCMATLALSELDVSMSENANANFSGSSAEMSLDISDNASLIAPLFSVSNADCSLTENASVQLMVLQTLDGSGSGNSVFQFVGNPNKDYTTKEQASLKAFKQ